jgi:hypothetical protein
LRTRVVVVVAAVVAVVVAVAAVPLVVYGQSQPCAEQLNNF